MPRQGPPREGALIPMKGTRPPRGGTPPRRHMPGVLGVGFRRLTGPRLGDAMHRAGRQPVDRPRAAGPRAADAAPRQMPGVGQWLGPVRRAPRAVASPFMTPTGGWARPTSIPTTSRGSIRLTSLGGNVTERGGPSVGRPDAPWRQSAREVRRDDTPRAVTHAGSDGGGPRGVSIRADRQRTAVSASARAEGGMAFPHIRCTDPIRRNSPPSFWSRRNALGFRGRQSSALQR